MTRLPASLFTLLCLSLPCTAQELTPWGAERAANADGSIPAHTGSTPPPANYDPARPGIRPDPFSADAPLFSITPHNYREHADKLSAGTIAMLLRYPTYRLDIYPSRRSGDYPDYVLRNMQHNAEHCRSRDEELYLENCRGGLPFPQPQTGAQVMWNHLLRYQAHAWQGLIRNHFVHGSGLQMLQSEIRTYLQAPFYAPEGTQDAGQREIYSLVRTDYTGPARRAGEAMLIRDSIDMRKGGRSVWQYLPGMRRVKLAPNLMYDTPNPHTGGTSSMDETQLFHGPLDRYDFTLLGKRELYIPYNSFALNDPQRCPASKKLHRHHLHPDCVRWELHRVWVVHATVKAGKRHQMPERYFYFDEDAPGAGVADSLDSDGQIARVAISLSFPMYEAQSMATDASAIYDFLTGSYSLMGDASETGGIYVSEPKSNRFFSPDALTGGGIR